MRNRVFIEGNNIYLRILTKEDVNENYIHWFDDEKVCEMNSHHRFPYSKETMSEYIDSVNNTGKQLVLGIVDKKNHKHVGNVSLQNINYINRSAEFAIVIGEKDYWGKSIGVECAKLIINHGFMELNLNRIYCGTFEKNKGMIKLAESIGFKKEGIRRKAEFKNGVYMDIIEYGLLRNEFAR